MSTIFVDTSYYIAIFNAKDAFHQRAKDLYRELLRNQKVTAEIILLEVYNYFSKSGHYWRSFLNQTWIDFHKDENYKILKLREINLDEGIQLYTRRPDKEYSLTDSISMSIIRRENIRQVLTTDHHFLQEGYEILMK